MTVRTDFTGRRIGTLTAVRPTERRIGRHRVWEFGCDCGQSTYCVPNDAAKRVRQRGTASCRRCASYRTTPMAPAGRSGAALRAVRRAARLTQGDVAARLGITTTRVACIEKADGLRPTTVSRFRGAVWAAVEEVAPAVRPDGWDDDRWFAAMQLRAACGMPVTPDRRVREWAA